MADTRSMDQIMAEIDEGLLVELYHLARTALAGQPGGDTKYARRIWASAEYSKRYPDVSPTGAYKAMERLQIGELVSRAPMRTRRAPRRRQ